MSHLNKQLNRLRLEHFESITAEKCLVATTATSATDKVEVTLPNSEAPTLRIQVQWRLGVRDVGGTILPRYPQRGNKGIVIYDDEDEAWLIY
jgi:hypothetical protein